MNRRAIPVYGLGVYRTDRPAPEGLFVGTLADSIARRYFHPHPHTHPFFQVFLVTGRGGFTQDFNDYALAGPTLVFSSPGQVHAVRLRPALRGTFISFTQEFFDGGMPPPSRLPDFPFFFSDLPPLLPLKGPEAAAFRREFADLRAEFDAGLPGAAEVIRARLGIIFVRAARLHARKHGGKLPSRPARLARAFRLAVEHRFHEETSLAAYAAALGVTPNHLNDTLRRETGQAAGALIRQRRLLEAKRLLLHSDLGIAEIGYRIGFGDPSYFGRFFRRAAGAAPAAFREGIREKYQGSRA